MGTIYTLLTFEAPVSMGRCVGVMCSFREGFLELGVGCKDLWGEEGRDFDGDGVVVG